MRKKPKKRRRPVNHHRSDDVYEVETILDVKGTKVGERKMLIRWEGYDSDHDVWVNERDVSRKAISDFDAKQSAGPKRRRPINHHKGDDVYEVQQIIDVTGTKVGERKMLIRWQGYDDEDDVWVAESDVSRKAVADFDGEYVNVTATDVSNKTKKNSNAFARLMASNQQIIELHGGKKSKQHRTSSHKSRTRLKKKPFKSKRRLFPQPAVLSVQESPVYPEVMEVLCMWILTLDELPTPKIASVYLTVYKCVQMSLLVRDPVKKREEYVVKKRKRQPLSYEEDEKRLQKGCQHAAGHAFRINQAILSKREYIKCKGTADEKKALMEFGLCYRRLTKVNVLLLTVHIP